MCYDLCNNNLKGDIIEEGHSIPSTGWLRLLDKLNVSTSMKEISDEAMENRDF